MWAIIGEFNKTTYKIFQILKSAILKLHIIIIFFDVLIYIYIHN